ncbi:MAG TPA: DNA polymerase III subunit gamma/tau [Pyrinomonadaceae bacterium]|jgi:DNA polymerase-3 subunit gamma/tau
MAYQVIARKWRPQTFEEVTGQESITRTLRNAIEHERLHHAYLFSGARGVGKTTTARLFAKALNCHRSDRPSPAPCRTGDPEECPSCREVAEGRSIDVLEIDAASNTGVDNVRDSIINTVGVRPARDRFKVFIIDEVHMLSGAAFNALLKTLEEPPPRVVFIMATTESHRIPDTILSRSQQFEFRTIAAARIMERLRLIADAEKIEVSDEALREIARAGEGSMRDAQSAFDQVISFSTGSIGAEEVETALGIAGAELLSRVMRAIAEGAPAEALRVVEDLVMRGHELRNFCRDLLAHVRDLLVAKVGGAAVELVDAGEAERKRLIEEAGAFSESDLVRFFHSLTETEKALRESAHPRYQLEVGLVKLIEMRRLVPLGQILERLSALEEQLRTGRAPASSAGGAAPPTSPAAGGSDAPPTRRTGATGRGGSSAATLSDASSNFSGASPTLESDAFGDAAGRTEESEAERPPFEPLPPRAKVEAAPVKSVESTTARVEQPTQPAPMTTTRTSNIKPIPSLPSRGNASPTQAQTPPPTTGLKLVSSAPSSLAGAASSPVAADAAAVPPSSPATASQSAPSSFFETSPMGAPYTGQDEMFAAVESPFVYEASSYPNSNAGTGAASPPHHSAAAPSNNVAASPASRPAASEAVERLKKLLDERRKPFLVTALEGARALRLEDDELYAEYAPEGRHLRDMLAKPDNVKILREVCREVAGRDMGVRIVVREAGADDDEAQRTQQDEERLEKQRLREMAEQHPSVQQLLKTFRAEIIDVRRVEPESQ